ncbi:glycoside hydrolase family 95 protein [Aliifodinibius sp. S!AR15-10]|uniref:glycosyl hydrolase family 95 catalytic domain-containing protein n=1 Tax=Aliifodinibius sp. S!AR15-10 TaxID=2950437 RepID=UPI0028656AF0|nr:hypothetical protein [Aliifodinibius sp. S!AR15-10]MDR8394590.1 glycoside hydrolase family 95 protein [Aliifodinibius sp. S!AR15-10]
MNIVNRFLFADSRSGYPRSFILLLLFGCLVLSISCTSEKPPQSSAGDFHFSELPTRWDEALPMGNGMVGALVWKDEDRLRFSLDRADLWDLREVKELKEITFDWVDQQVKRNDYEPVQQLGDAPYNQYPYPTKIQAAALEFDTEKWGPAKQAQLRVKPAITEVAWEQGPVLQTFVHAEQPVGWFRFKGVPEDFKPSLEVPEYFTEHDGPNAEAGQQQSHRLADLSYEQGSVVEEGNTITYTQPGHDMSYQVIVSWENDGNTCEGVWSITSKYSNDLQVERAEDIALQALSEGYESSKASHMKWWNQYWARSDLQVPDTLLQKQWEREMYKFGSAARPGAPPISLQAVWTADNGSLPPWKGDYHHDLNTQLSYWPGYSGNHLELTRSYTDWLWSIREESREYTRWYFESDGLNVPGVSTLTGQPMGGWIQYAMSPTTSAWLGQHFYWQWTYGQDEQFLKEQAYPYLHEVAVYLEDVTHMEDGVRTLQLSSSPEMHDNSIDAWFDELTNYDLALMKNAFGMAAELAGELGKRKERERWQMRRSELPDLATNDETGLLVAPGEPLEYSHRHFSHLISIHPLGLLDPAHGEQEEQLIEKSLEHLAQIGSDNWVGYSFSWQANLYARAGNGGKAAEALRIFASNFVSSNSFHVNGDQKGGQYSNLTYRPFTLEGNFAFAAGLQEMLLQSNTGVIEIFPAIPGDWEDVGFDQLRAQGAFLVSAEMEKGKVSDIHIRSEKGGLLQVANPFDSQAVKVMKMNSDSESFQEVESKWENSILSIQTNPNDEVKLLHPNN